MNIRKNLTEKKKGPNQSLIELGFSLLFGLSVAVIGTLLLSGCIQPDDSTGFKPLDPGSVDNDLIVRITSSLPTTQNVTLTNSTSQIFTISAVGKKSITYNWLLDNQLTSTDSSYELVGSTLTSGNHTLKALASDSSSSDSRTWTVKKNLPPVISSPLPTNSVYKMNYNASKTFSITATDPNSDSLTYVWTLNSVPLVGTTDSINLSTSGST
jgi:chitinase